MKIYKYNILKTPDAVEFARGFFQFKDYAIGFGEDITTPDMDKECQELTFNEYLDYIDSIGADTNQATEIYNKYATLVSSTILGEKVTDKKQVSELLRKNVQALFIDPSGLLTPLETQIFTLSQILTILLAQAGTIEYKEIGITGIIDKASADAYVVSLLPIWGQVNTLTKQAMQFVSDNSL